MNSMQNVIKWSGSKRSQSSEIIKFFPKEIDIYYEPFCGSCSVMHSLMFNESIVNKYRCSDSNHDLINLWNNIKNSPSELSEGFRRNSKYKWNRAFMECNQ